MSNSSNSASNNNTTTAAEASDVAMNASSGRRSSPESVQGEIDVDEDTTNPDDSLLETGKNDTRKVIVAEEVEEEEDSLHGPTEDLGGTTIPAETSADMPKINK